VSANPTLNERARALADDMAANADILRIAVHQTQSGARVLDCGVKAEGGLQAGLGLARVCLAGLAEVSLVPGEVDGVACPHVQVASDQPVLACMASQYAGWQIKVEKPGDRRGKVRGRPRRVVAHRLPHVEKFFGMGSGPMRAAYGKEELFDHIPGRERPTVAVGVLETRKLPGDEVAAYLAERLQLAPAQLTLLAAPVFSLAGTVQVVARSLETALHKLHELKFDLKQVASGYGVAPLPPPAADELAALGRTNDAILYGGRVVLWVRAPDDALAEVGPKVPSSASPDHGAPFAEVFERAGRDFYKIDPMLFSPAELVLCNLTSGRCHCFGKTAADVLRRSFFAA
jgi:methenyltetrahydromethanopterin cyclohydrolase